MWRQLDSAVSNCMGIDQYLHSTLYGSVLKLWIVQIHWHQIFFSQAHLLWVYKYCRNESRYLVAICIPTGFIPFIFVTFTQLREITHTQEIMSALADIGSLADWPVTVVDLLICLKMAPPMEAAFNKRQLEASRRRVVLCCKMPNVGGRGHESWTAKGKKEDLPSDVKLPELPSGSLW